MKVDDVQLQENFWLSEFKCKGYLSGKCSCDSVKVDYRLHVLLQQLRAKIGQISIAIGYRCPEFNSKIANASPNSQHMYGRAADIKTSLTPHEVAKAAEELGFTGIGAYTHNGYYFTHVDTREGAKSFWHDSPSGALVKVDTFKEPIQKPVNKHTLQTKDGIKYVEVDPLDLNSQLVNSTASTLAKTYPNFTGGMFNDKNPNWPADGRLFCLLAVNGKRIFTTQSYDKKAKGTLVVYDDGKVQVATVRDLLTVKGTKLVIQGFNLNYEANGSRSMDDSILAEGWLSDVYRETTRSAIGYNPAKEKLIIAHITGTANDLRLAMRKLGCIFNGDTYGIGLDAGSVDCFAVNGEVVVNGSARHILTF
jgi:hypothetical protein